MSFAGVGILLNVHNNTQIEYAAVTLITMGAFTTAPLVVSWYMHNLRGHYARAIGSAWVISFGNLGGIIATFSFLSQDAPLYHTGYSIIVLGLCLLAGAALAYTVGIHIENRKLARMGPVASDRAYLL